MKDKQIWCVRLAFRCQSSSGAETPSEDTKALNFSSTRKVARKLFGQKKKKTDQETEVKVKTHIAALQRDDCCAVLTQRYTSFLVLFFVSFHHLCNAFLLQLKFQRYWLHQDGWLLPPRFKLAHSIIRVSERFLDANMYFTQSYLDPPMQAHRYNPSIHQCDRLRPLPGQWVPCGFVGRGGSVWWRAPGTAVWWASIRWWPQIPFRWHWRSSWSLAIKTNICK